MYKLKKIFALILATVLAISSSTVAFASEDENGSGIPENATKHTIEVTVEPGESIEGNEDGIAPYIWGNSNTNVSSDKTYLAQFNIPERYFAYEYSAVPTSGGTSSGNYSVSLLYASGLSTIAEGAGIANGSITKVDWIDLSPGTYQFLITNKTGISITVSITYYSWK